MVRHSSAWGTKLAPRIAMLVMRSIIYTHSRLHHVKHKLAMAVFHAISDEISEEVDITLGPFLQKLHDELPEDHPAYPSVHFMHTVSGQLKALAGTGLQISGLLGSIAAIMNNELAANVYTIVGANPGQLPDASTVAQSYATNLVGRDEALHAIGAQGIQYGWADRMLALSFNRPGLTEAIELRRRNLILDEDFIQYLTWNGITHADAQKLLSLVGTPLSPADLALAVLRGNMDENTAVPQAAESGVSPDQFKVLLDNTGEPPGLMQLLEAYRRGFIDEHTLRRGILQSRYRNEWIPMLEKLRYEPMSVADAVNAVVQNQMDSATANSIAEQNGLEPGAFDILARTAGEPLSRTEMEQLYNRGLVSKDQVIQALRESRLKNKYNEFAFDLHSRLLPITTLGEAIRTGSITHDQAVSKAMELGYSKQDATIYVDAGSKAKLESARNRVISSVASLYQDNIMSLADATAMIQGLAFSPDEAKFVLESAEFHREAHILTTAVNAIKGKYLQHHITLQEASGLLDSTGIASEQRDQLLHLWEIEHGAFVRLLTPAQIIKAHKLQLITDTDALTRLTNLGYSDIDAKLLLEGA